MITNNQGFVCISCGNIIPKAEKTSRNHCPHCFVSLHVDDLTPGDRASSCKGLMVPQSYFLTHGTIKITFVCLQCGHIHNNKTASDDQIVALDQVIQKWKKHIDQ